MKLNEGAVDRILRIVLGIAILSLVFVGPRTPWAWLGLVPLLTGVIGFCPLYAVLGISTPGPGRREGIAVTPTFPGRGLYRTNRPRAVPELTSDNLNWPPTR